MGYETDRFEGHIIPTLICTICFGVFEDPVQTAECEHYFCKECITDWLQSNSTCPQDRLRLTVSDLKEVSRFVKTTLADLDIRCSFRPVGCQDTVKFDLLEGHESKCVFNEEALVACDRDCGGSIKRKDVGNHCCLVYLKGMIKEKEEIQKAMMTAFDGEREKMREAFRREVSTVQILMKEKDKTMMNKLTEEIKQNEKAQKDLLNEINAGEALRQEINRVKQLNKETEKKKEQMSQEINRLKEEVKTINEEKKELRKNVKILQEELYPPAKSRKRKRPATSSKSETEALAKQRRSKANTTRIMTDSSSDSSSDRSTDRSSGRSSVSSS